MVSSPEGVRDRSKKKTHAEGEPPPKTKGTGGRALQTMLEAVTGKRGATEPPSPEEQQATEATLEASVAELAERLKHPDEIDADPALSEEVKDAASFAAKIVETLDAVPAERRALAMTRLQERVQAQGWRKRKTPDRERLAFMIIESRRIQAELAAEGTHAVEGVSQTFGKQTRTQDALATAGYAGVAADRTVIAGAEFGVTATGLMALMQAGGIAVGQLSPAHLVALAAAGLLVPIVEAAKGHAVSSLAKKKVSFGVLAAATTAVGLAGANSGTFLYSFGLGDQAADTVGAMTRAIDSMRRDLEQIRVRADENTSALEHSSAQIETFFTDLINAEVSGESRPGVGGSGNQGVGPTAAIKQGLLGMNVVEIPDSIASRPDVSERVRAARARINERLSRLGENGEYQLREGESVPEAIRRYMNRFGDRSGAEFEQLEGYIGEQGQTVEGEYADLMLLAESIQTNAEPMQAKLNTMTAQPTPGAPELEREKREIREVIAALAARYEQEVGVPIATLLTIVSEEMNRLGDPTPIEIEVPEFNPSTSALDDVPIPGARFDVAMLRSVLVDKFGEKGIWALLFTLFAFSGMGLTYAQMRYLRKKQAPEIAHRKEALFGTDTEEGLEQLYAKGMAERLTSQLYAADGFLSSEGITTLLPFKPDLQWFQLSPLDVMVALREEAAKEYKGLATQQEGGVFSRIKDAYIAGLTEPFRLVPETEEVQGLNALIRVVGDYERRALAVESHAIPGLSNVMKLASELAVLSRERAGGEPTREMREKAREFQGAVLKMSFDHLAFRARTAQTSIALLRTMYADLRATGEFKDLDVVGLTELPRDISFDLRSEAELPEAFSNEVLRGSALRSTTIDVLEKRLRKEQDKLDKLTERMDVLVNTISALPGRAGAADPEFVKLAALTRAELEKAKTAFREHTDAELAEFTSHNGIKDTLLKDVKKTTRTRMREQLAGEDSPEPTRTFEARTQLSAIREAVVAGVEKISLPGYAVTARLERKGAGDTSVADYLAIVLRVERQGKGAIATEEFPLRSVLGAGTDPADAARIVSVWMRQVPEHFTLAQTLDAATDEIEGALRNSEGVGERSMEVRSDSRDAAERIREFYQNTLPQRSRVRQLREIRSGIGALRAEFDAKTRKRFSEAEYSRMMGAFSALRKEQQKVMDYPYDFSARERTMTDLVQRLAGIKGLRATLRLYDPVRVGTEQAETFGLEKVSLISFGGRRQSIVATVEQLERALATSPTTYDALVAALNQR